MFRTAEHSSTLQRASAVAPSLVASLVVTELFFKFGSFTVELLACCALWGFLYGGQTLVARLLKKPTQ